MLFIQIFSQILTENNPRFFNTSLKYIFFAYNQFLILLQSYFSNQFLKIYGVEIKPGMLQVSAGTMGPVFDTNLEDLFPEQEEGLAGISIRGFIHDFDEVMKRLESLKPKESRKTKKGGE